jgi:hypothetical protein
MLFGYQEFQETINVPARRVDPFLRRIDFPYWPDALCQFDNLIPWEEWFATALGTARFCHGSESLRRLTVISS